MIGHSSSKKNSNLTVVVRKERWCGKGEPLLNVAVSMGGGEEQKMKTKVAT